ncbi:MAG TPA: SidA/IucD/PvdA family monooxygenase [Solirubrobacterales bacterium]|nr:SidA/IucD/PvdA family monooxygenase [Solirubrobacterales bacterium]
MPAPIFDLLGIGIGPSNLSLAALADRVSGAHTIFCERRDRVDWQPGMHFPGATTQTPYLKDLVSLVDPTSPYSFVNFLVQTGRIFRFLARSDGQLTRREYEQYYRWAAAQLNTLRFGTPVEHVGYEPDVGFVATTPAGTFLSRKLVIATGSMAHFPSCVAHLRGSHVHHADEFLARRPDTAGKRVLIVGGGQSGGEVVLHLLTKQHALPRKLIWATRSAGFPLTDQSPFANEWFNPRYVEHFHGLDVARRRFHNAFQKYASDGIIESTLSQIYRRLYELDFVEDLPFEHRVLLGCELVEGSRHHDEYRFSFQTDDVEGPIVVDSDVAILATGYEARLPICVADLQSRFSPDWRESIAADYRVDWDGRPEHSIYVQGSGRLSHGIADPHLSLGSWRSAVILNSLYEREIYPTSRGSTTIRWLGGAPRDSS